MQWICDTCGMPISEVKDGWVEWQARNAEGVWIKHSPRIVHHRPASPRAHGCQYEQDAIYANGQNIVGDLPLDLLVGADGLITLLSFVSDGYFGLEPSLDLIQRLQVPDYDLVRRHFNEAIGEGVFEPNSKAGYYDIHQIEAVKDWLKTRD